MLTKDIRHDETEPAETISAAPDVALIREHLNVVLASDEFSSSRRASELLPLDPDLAWGYGFDANALFHFDDALEAYRRYTALAPLDPRGWSNEGTVLVELGRFDESQACFDRALALRPGMIPALNGKGSAYYYARRFETARSLWAKVLDLDPRDPTATRNMSTLVKMGY